MPYDLTPEQERAMREMYLWGFEQPDAFGMPMGMQTDPYSMGGVFMEPGSMKGSEIKNYMQLMSDPAMIAQLGAGPGGFRPEDFESTMSYEPVRQPGREALNYAQQSGDPIFQLMAEVIGGGGSSFEAEQVIRDVLADPENPWFEQVSARMPQYQDQVTGDFLPDWRRLSTISQSLMEDSINDPMGDMIDPNTGMAMNVSEEMSPAAEYFRRAGLPLPTERYGMEQWRGMDELDAMRGNAAAIPQVQNQEALAQDSMDTLRQQMLAMQLMTPPPPGNGKAVASQGLLPSGGALGAGSPGPAGSSRPFPMQSEDPFDVASRAMADQLDQGMGMGGSFGLEREDRAYSADGHRGGPRAAPSRGAPQPSGTQSQMDLMRRKRMAQTDRKLQKTKAEVGRLGTERVNRQAGVGEFRGQVPTHFDQAKQRILDQSGRNPLNDTLAARREAMLRYGLQF